MQDEHESLDTLLRSGFEWPKDQAQLLMYSGYVRNLHDSKIERIFEIVQANLEITLFIHFYSLK